MIVLVYSGMVLLLLYIGVVLHLHSRFHQQMMGMGDMTRHNSVQTQDSVIDTQPQLPDATAMPITTLIIATVPYDHYHAKALWSHLECLTENINHVVIAAPDADWSRSIVDAIVTKFQAALSNQNKDRSISKTIIIEADYFVNDRYDVGLWCDALKSNYRYRRNTVPRNQATFLVNDSAFSVRKYVELNDRIINATKQESSSSTVNSRSLKLLSLNGG